MLILINKILAALKDHMDVFIDFLHGLFKGNLVSISWESKRTEALKREIKISNRVIILILVLIVAAILTARYWGI